MKNRQIKKKINNSCKIFTKNGGLFIQDANKDYAILGWTPDEILEFILFIKNDTSIEEYVLRWCNNNGYYLKV